jgi:Uma2 family endonuclease
MKLVELEQKFNEKCIYWSKQHDLGNKIIYSVGFIVNNVLFEQGVVVYIKNRGTDDEEVYFVGSVPPFMIEQQSQNPLEKLKDDIISKCGFNLVESYNANTIGNFAIITGYVDVEGKMVRKQVIAYLKNDEIIIKEVQ